MYKVPNYQNQSDLNDNVNAYDHFFAATNFFMKLSHASFLPRFSKELAEVSEDSRFREIDMVMGGEDRRLSRRYISEIARSFPNPVHFFSKIWPERLLKSYTWVWLFPERYLKKWMRQHKKCEQQWSAMLQRPILRSTKPSGRSGYDQTTIEAFTAK